MLAAGIPDTVPVQVINRFCSSGLMAVTTIANQVRSGQIEIGLAIGVESMSDKYVLAIFGRRHLQSCSYASPDKGGPEFSELISCNPASNDCKERMGWTSENVAEDFDVTREEQDTFAAESFQKAEHAQKNGYFSEEIVPFTVLRKEPNSIRREPKVVREDDGIRYGTTAETLSKIKSAFPQWGNGTTTGGNASQITDGAAAILMMTRREAERRNLPIQGKHIRTAVVGVCDS